MTHQPSLDRFHKTSTAGGQPERALQSADAFFSPALQLADHDAMELKIHRAAARSEDNPVVMIQLMQARIIHGPDPVPVSNTGLMAQAHPW
jgi:hypothetical protein